MTFYYFKRVQLSKKKTFIFQKMINLAFDFHLQSFKLRKNAFYLLFIALQPAYLISIHIL